MLSVRPDRQAVRQQLERVLGSAGFTRNERLSRFLRYVVEQSLEGRDSEIKESVIAVEVFGRNGDYDPKVDSIVRTEASRLRARLTEYYSGEGRNDPVVVELPKGGYIPLFCERDAREQQQEERLLRKKPTLRYYHLGLAIAAVVFLFILAAGGGWWWRHRNSELVTVAVLPLESLSPDRTNDYFADGLTDEIIRDLSVIEGLAVRSHTSSFAFKGKPASVRDVARELNVDYIVEGSVLRDGTRLRINAQLVRARDDMPLWSDEFDRELQDVFAIQDEISRSIVNNLRLKFGRGRRRYETSVEAYDLYLRARAQLIQLGIYRGYNPQSIGLFEQAIAKDPSFAPAYAGLASAYATVSAGGVFVAGLDQVDKLDRMRTAAENAIQLDPLLAEAHEALAMAYARDGQLEQSEKSFRRAIELDPSLSLAYDEFAMDLLLPLGRIEEALQAARVAERTDPLSPAVQQILSTVLISAGRYNEAAEHCQNLPADYSQKKQCLGRALLGQGRIDEAIQILTTADSPGYLGNAYARAGRQEEAEELAATTRDNFNRALIFAGLGDKDRTIQALDRMTALGPVRLGRTLTFPELAFLRGDQRVKALRKKVGLPE